MQKTIVFNPLKEGEAVKTNIAILKEVLGKVPLDAADLHKGEVCSYTMTTVSNGKGGFLSASEYARSLVIQKVVERFGTGEMQGKAKEFLEAVDAIDFDATPVKASALGKEGVAAAIKMIEALLDKKTLSVSEVPEADRVALERVHSVVANDYSPDDIAAALRFCPELAKEQDYYGSDVIANAVGVLLNMLNPENVGEAHPKAAGADAGLVAFRQLAATEVVPLNVAILKKVLVQVEKPDEKDGKVYSYTETKALDADGTPMIATAYARMLIIREVLDRFTRDEAKRKAEAFLDAVERVDFDDAAVKARELGGDGVKQITAMLEAIQEKARIPVAELPPGEADALELVRRKPQYEVENVGTDLISNATGSLMQTILMALYKAEK